MQILKKTLLSISLFTSIALQAQDNQHTHQHHRGCSVGLEAGAQIRERMMSQREDANLNALIALRNNATIYIPVAITSVANSEGVGHANLNNLLGMLCDMNNDYADQNIVFYLKDSIRYRNYNPLYNDAFSNQAISYMSQQKVPNAVNIYVSPTVNNSVASYYMPSGDFVFIITAEANGSSNTATHEVGHFFSLNHTFYGWEGISYHDRYQTTATPQRIGGETVENVARTGTNKNCERAADGFCDTPADYISDRWNCPYVGVNGVLATDPLGVATDPDEANYMSYFFDQCVISFSNEQKAAILRDITRRGWLNNAPPTVMGTININNFRPIAPINDFNTLVNGENNIVFSWEPIQNANMYILEIDRLLAGQPVPPNLKILVNSNGYTLNTSLLQAITSTSTTHSYRWSVRPMNNIELCGPSTSYATFKASLNGTQVSVEEVSENAQLGILVMPNPIHNNQVRVQIATYEAQEVSLRIFAADGRLVMQQHKEQLAAGENMLSVDLGNIANGLYTLVVTDNKGNTKASRFTVLGN